MKITSSFPVAMCFSLLLSCAYDTSERDLDPGVLIGAWRSETIYLDGVNSKEYIDFLNDGTVFIIKPDKTFNRNYVLGSWKVIGQYLLLDGRPEYGKDGRVYRIIDYSENSLTLEQDITLGDYCCGSEFFPEDQVLKIREVYKRLPD